MYPGEPHNNSAEEDGGGSFTSSSGVEHLAGFSCSAVEVTAWKRSLSCQI